MYHHCIRHCGTRVWITNIHSPAETDRDEAAALRCMKPVA